MTAAEVLNKLESLGNPETVSGLERYGIVTPRSFGITAPVLKQFAREVKKHAKDRHTLAQELWDTGIYDARAVAFLIDDPKQVTRHQMEAWSRDFDNWASVVCANYEDDLSPDQRQAIAAIEHHLSAMSDDDPDVWSRTAVLEDERWDEIRRLACVALDAFGWAIEPGEDISSAATPPE